MKVVNKIKCVICGKIIDFDGSNYACKKCLKEVNK